MTRSEIEAKLEKLREEYRKAIGVDRKLIEIRGKLLKRELLLKDQLFS